jgi:hypothetical protein
VSIPEAIKEVAESKLGSPCEFIYNESKSYILSYSSQSNDLVEKTKFLVIRVSDAEIIQSGDFRPGYIKWVSENTIEYLDAPGIIRPDETLDQYTKKIVLDQSL